MKLFLLISLCSISLFGFSQTVLTLNIKPAESTNELVLIDGFFNESIWQENAVTVALSDSIQLLICQDVENVFIGIKSIAKTTKTFTDLFICNPSIEQINLHASAQLGERVIVDDSWDVKINPWKWGNNVDWVANTTQFDKSKSKDLPMILKYIPFEGQEFSISKEKIKMNKLRIRIEVSTIDLKMALSKIDYPANADKLKPSTWLKLVL